MFQLKVKLDLLRTKPYEYGIRHFIFVEFISTKIVALDMKVDEEIIIKIICQIFPVPKSEHESTKSKCPMCDGSSSSPQKT
jgi:hypothetical protein